MALLVVQAFGLSDRLSATFVAVVCISPTLYSGLRRGFEQLGASAIGGALAFALSRVLPLPATLAAALFCAIFLSFRIGLARGYLVAAFAVLYVLFVPGAGAGQVLEARLAAVLVGLLSSTVLNLVVSWASWRAVFRRRLGIAREQVAGAWEQLASQLASGAGRAERSSFDNVFVLLRALHEELADAAKESALSDRRELLSAAARGVWALLDAAHHGRDLELLLVRQKEPLPQAGRYASVLGRSLRGEPFEGERTFETVSGPALEAAAAAIERAIQCLAPWKSR